MSRTKNLRVLSAIFAFVNAEWGAGTRSVDFPQRRVSLFFGRSRAGPTAVLIHQLQHREDVVRFCAEVGSTGIV